MRLIPNDDENMEWVEDYPIETPVTDRTELGINTQMKWADRGACVNYSNPDYFFQESGGRLGNAFAAAALQVCGTCPVIEQCLEYALKNEVIGIWGGLMTYERKALIKQNS